MKNKKVILGILCFFFSFVIASAFPANEISHWKFENNFLDENGNYDGTAFDVSFTSGVFGQAASFDGSGDHINFGDISELNSVDEFTITMWVRDENISDYKFLFEKGDGFANDISSSTFLGNLYFEVGNGANSFAHWPSYADLSDWNHVAFVFNGNGVGNSQKAKIYVNGIQQPLSFSGTFPSTTANMALSDFTLSNSGSSWQGQFDDVYLFSRALTQEEIQEVILGEQCEHDVGIRYTNFTNALAYSNSFGTGIAIKPKGNDWFPLGIPLNQAQIYLINYYIDNKMAAANNIHVLLKLDNTVLADYQTSITDVHSNTIELNVSGLTGYHNLTLSVEKVNETDCNLTDNFAQREILILAPENNCGNGIIEGDEQCDDGNSNDYDECSNTCEFGLRKLSLETCQGEADFFAYHSTPVQDLEKEFITQRDELYVLTRADFISNVNVYLNNVIAPKTTVVSTPNPFGVKVYRVFTTPGDLVRIEDSSIHDSRAIQGFLTQDSSQRAIDIATFNIVFDDTQTDTMSLVPGSYDFIVFDKYTQDPPCCNPDDRRLTITVENSVNSIIFQKNYTDPFPGNVEGIVLDSYTIPAPGNYEFILDTEDSVYWFLQNCTLTPPCPDEDGDGVCDEDDDCPNSSPNEPVDEEGCDPFQFCEQFSCGYDCLEADFLDNEQEARRPGDCTVIIPHSNGFLQQPVCRPTVISNMCFG